MFMTFLIGFVKGIVLSQIEAVFGAAEHGFCEKSGSEWNIPFPDGTESNPGFKIYSSCDSGNESLQEQMDCQNINDAWHIGGFDGSPENWTRVMDIMKKAFPNATFKSLKQEYDEIMGRIAEPSKCN